MGPCGLLPALGTIEKALGLYIDYAQPIGNPPCGLVLLSVPVRSLSAIAPYALLVYRHWKPKWICADDVHVGDLHRLLHVLAQQPPIYQVLGE